MHKANSFEDVWAAADAEQDPLGLVDESADLSGQASFEPLYARASELAQIQVHVTVELGRVSLTALDILALKRGMTLEVPRPEDGTVEVSVDGEILGRGAIREEDGQIIVEILNLSWEQSENCPDS